LSEHDNQHTQSITVINGDKRSVLIFHTPTQMSMTSTEVKMAIESLEGQLLGTCLEGCRILFFGKDIELTIVNANDAKKDSP